MENIKRIPVLDLIVLNEREEALIKKILREKERIV